MAGHSRGQGCRVEDADRKTEVEMVSGRGWM